MVGNGKGFTALELLVVIGVMAIVLGVAIPSYSNWLPDINLRSAIRNIKSDMELAKLTAIRQSTNYALVFDTANNSYTVFSDYDGDLVLDTGDGEITLKRVSMPRNITVSAGETTFVDKRVGFSNRGIPYKSGLANLTDTRFVTLQNINSKKRRVSVTLVGLARVERWNGSAWVKD